MLRRAALLTLLLAGLASPTRSDLAGQADRFQFAEGLLRRGMTELALREYQTLLNDPSPDLLDVIWFRIGEAQRQLRNPQDAILAYTRVIEDHPQSLFHHRAAYRRAEIELALDRPDQAADQLDTLLKQKPPPDIAAAARYTLGLAHQQRNRPRDAQRAFRAVLKDYPTSPFRSFAALALDDLLHDQPDALPERRQLLQSVADQPENDRQGAEALYRLILLEQQAQQPLAAAQTYETLLQRHPAQARTRDAALPAATANLDANLPQPHAWRYLAANAARSLDQPARAIAEYRTLLLLPPTDLTEPSRLELASLLLAQNLPLEAIQLLQPHTPSPQRADDHHWILARAALRARDLPTAETHLLHLIQHATDPLRRAEALHEHARLAQIDQQWQLAADRFLAFAKQHPDHPLAPSSLHAAGSNSLRAENLPPAITAWKQLIKKHPDYPERPTVLLSLARAYIQTDQTEPALQTLQTLLNQAPDSPLAPEAHFLRGQLVEDQAFEAAEFHYLAALRLDPPPALALSIQLRRIAALQRLAREPEAANLLTQLLDTQPASGIPEPLLEWFARWSLQQELYPQAAQAADLLAQNASTPAWRQLGHLIAGTARRHLGQTPDARRNFQLALDTNLPGRPSAEAALALAELALQRNDPAAAAPYYQQAAQLASEDTTLDLRARAYFGLAETHRLTQQWDDAARLYLSVAILFDHPELTPLALHHAADAFTQLERPLDRQRALHDLLERYPQHPLAQPHLHTPQES